MPDKAIKADAVIVKPRGISRDLTVQQPGRYPAGLHLEIQKFGNKDKTRQLLLWEGWEEGTTLQEEIEILGLDLSLDQLKAVKACQILLTETGYKGNLAPVRRSPPGYSESIDCPRLSITADQYFEAYGLPPGTKGKARALALDGLISLTEKQKTAYERTRYEGKKKIKDVIIAHSPLMILYEGHTDVRDGALKILSGRSKGRVTHLLIEFMPIWVDQIGSFYTLKPIQQHEEIKAYLGSGKYSKTIAEFQDLLMTWDFSPIKIRKELLLERLRLDRMRVQRNTGRMWARLQEAVDVALGLGYLLSYEEDPTGLMYIFHLNPERCSRVKPGKLSGPDEEQEL